MKINQLHDWEVTASKAQAIQKGLRPWIMLEDQLTDIERYLRIRVHLQDDDAVRVNCLHVSPDHKVLEQSSVEGIASFSFEDGLLSFSIAPFILRAIEELTLEPSLIICDGRGIRSASSFGLASHIGLLTNMPTMGVRLVKSEMRNEVNNLVPNTGDWVSHTVDEQPVSAYVNLSSGLPLLEVSPGHRISLETAIEMAQNISLGALRGEARDLWWGSHNSNGQAFSADMEFAESF